MKFGEKLMKLRKEKGLSQEELGEALDVTRQTISKWELGQSKPDMDKLMAMSKFFGVDISTLTDENTNYKKENNNNDDDGKNRKIIMVALIIGAILIVVLICGNMMSKKSNKQQVLNNAVETSAQADMGIIEKFFDFFERIFDKIMGSDVNVEANGSVWGNVFEKISASEFNNGLDMSIGEKSGFLLKSDLNDIMETNGKHTDKTIMVIFNDKEYANNEEIKKIYSEIKEKNKYILECEYDQNGYITKVIITDNSIDEAFENQELENQESKNQGFENQWVENQVKTTVEKFNQFFN